MRPEVLEVTSGFPPPDALLYKGPEKPFCLPFLRKVAFSPSFLRGGGPGRESVYFLSTSIALRSAWLAETT